MMAGPRVSSRFFSSLEKQKTHEVEVHHVSDLEGLTKQDRAYALKVKVTAPKSIGMNPKLRGNIWCRLGLLEFARVADVLKVLRRRAECFDGQCSVKRGWMFWGVFPQFFGGICAWVFVCWASLLWRCRWVCEWLSFGGKEVV